MMTVITMAIGDYDDYSCNDDDVVDLNYWFWRPVFLIVLADYLLQWSLGVAHLLEESGKNKN